MSSLTVQQIKQTLREKIPEGIVVPRHTERGHFYEFTPTKEIFASVTTKSGILDMPHLKMWSARLAVEYYIDHVDFAEDLELLKKAAILAHHDKFTKAGQLGSLGHGVIDNYLQAWLKTGIRPESIIPFNTHTDPRVEAIILSAEQFMSDFRAIPIASEMYLASAKHKYAGTLDSLMMVKPPGKRKHEFVIGDWKSGNQIQTSHIIKPEYAMQTAAYLYALKEMTGLKPDRIYIIRLDKMKVKYEVCEVKNVRGAFKAFVNLSKVYDWINQNKKEMWRTKREYTVVQGEETFTFTQV